MKSCTAFLWTKCKRMREKLVKCGGVTIYSTVFDNKEDGIKV